MLRAEDNVDVNRTERLCRALTTPFQGLKNKWFRSPRVSLRRKRLRSTLGCEYSVAPRLKIISVGRHEVPTARSATNLFGRSSSLFTCFSFSKSVMIMGNNVLASGQGRASKTCRAPISGSACGEYVVPGGIVGLEAPIYATNVTEKYF